MSDDVAVAAVLRAVNNIIVVFDLVVAIANDVVAVVVRVVVRVAVVLFFV